MFRSSQEKNACHCNTLEFSAHEAALSQFEMQQCYYETKSPKGLEMHKMSIVVYGG